MSLVGTRPILPDELEQYELHHRARIAIKPGITGMWQVSGRSDITDFEEIVRLDTESVADEDSVKKFHVDNVDFYFLPNGKEVIVELCQIVLRVGTFQISDLVTNTGGGLIGGIIYWIHYKLRNRE